MRSFSSIRFSAVLLMFWVTVMSPGQVRAQGESEVSESTLASILRKEAIAYENGEGVPRDLVLAATLYCKSARLGDPEAQYNLGWMYANGRGPERNDVAAAFSSMLLQSRG